jgi:predicted phage terminase large subunit-like protein
VNPDVEEVLASDAWRTCLATYAHRASGGRWVPYRWLRYLAGVLQEAATTPGSRVIVNAPPRHGKSALVSTWFPVWLLDTWPDRTIGLVSYVESVAAEFSGRVRAELEGNPSTLTRVVEDSRAAARWKTAREVDGRLRSAGGGVVAAGIGGPIVGRGFDLAIVDDPHKSWEEAHSPASLERLKSWWAGTFLPRLEPGASVVVVHQRWHAGDLSGWLLDEYPGEWKHVELPALSLGPEDPIGRPAGAALCPARYQSGFLRDLRRKNPAVFEALYQQRPRARSGNTWTVSRLRYWTRDPDKARREGYVLLPDRFESSIQSWDFSGGGLSNASSFTVGQVWSKVGGARFLRDQWRDRVRFPGMLEALRRMQSAYPEATKIVVEDKASGRDVVDVLEREIAGIVRRSPVASKETRAVAVSPFFESGSVVVPDPTIPGFEWVRELVEEWGRFPNSPTNDQVDAASQALSELDETEGEFLFAWA